MSPRIPHIARLIAPAIETPRLVRRPAAPPNTNPAQENPANEEVAAPAYRNGIASSDNCVAPPDVAQEFIATTEVQVTEMVTTSVETNNEALHEQLVCDVSTHIGEESPREESPGEESLAEAAQNDESEKETLDDSIADELGDDLEDEPYAPDPVSRRTQREPSSAREFDILFAEWKESGDPRIRERLILMNRNLVSYIARRFMDRGEMSEDIIQQGLIGLINALDHFDPSRGVRFATFATPTIMGEIRRYFRDKSWGIRVPRRLQELNQVINARIDELTQTLDRSPTYVEIARSLNLQLEEVVEALEMASVLDPMSIDEEVSFGNNDSPTTVGDQIGAPDPQLEGWGEYAALQAALEKLPEKERRVLEMVYFNDHSQVEVARQMNVSQMFVSRLQRRALAHLRELMNGHDI